MTEELGMTMPTYDDNGNLLTNDGSPTDEMGRIMHRNDSRDPHDTTCFTTVGDGQEDYVGAALGTGDASTTRFYFGGKSSDVEYPTMADVEEGLHKDVFAVTLYADAVEIPADDYVLDASTAHDGNQFTSVGRGRVDFNTAPAAGVVITADYSLKVIGGGSGDKEAFYDQAAVGNSDPKTFNLCFCDPVHIKDGRVTYTGGAKDSLMDVYAFCPAGLIYKNDAGEYRVAMAERQIAHYVIKQRLLGDGPAPGVPFDVEARSTAMLPTYCIRIIITPGSATDLVASMRLELNRERTAIK